MTSIFNHESNIVFAYKPQRFLNLGNRCYIEDVNGVAALDVNRYSVKGMRLI